jgi:hypothetical protein
MALGHRHLWRQRPVQLQNDLAVTDLRSSQYQPDQLLPLEGCQTSVDLADLAQSGAYCIRRHQLPFDLLEVCVNMKGWLLVLTLANLILASAIVWFAIAQGWP